MAGRDQPRAYEKSNALQAGKNVFAQDEWERNFENHYKIERRGYPDLPLCAGRLWLPKTNIWCGGISLQA
jgi:hypothetical protein